MLRSTRTTVAGTGVLIEAHRYRPQTLSGSDSCAAYALSKLSLGPEQLRGRTLFISQQAPELALHKGGPSVSENKRLYFSLHEVEPTLPQMDAAQPGFCTTQFDARFNLFLIYPQLSRLF